MKDSLIRYRYTVLEIEDMRESVRQIHLTESRYDSNMNGGYIPDSTANHHAIIEDHLRTYLLAGVRPAALKKRADEKLADMFAKWKQVKAEREALRQEAINAKADAQEVANVRIREAEAARAANPVESKTWTGR